MMEESAFQAGYEAGQGDSSRMSEVEIQALYIHKDELIERIDPLLLSDNLHQHDKLSDETLSDIESMFESDQDRQVVVQTLISQLPFSTNIHGLVQSLDECGYRDLAARLFLSFLKMNIGAPSHVHKTSSGQRAGVHTFFRRLKRMVHDAQFKDPRQALRNLAVRYETQLTTESDPTKKQFLADKCVAIIGAEIDAIAITFDDKLYEHDVFSKMKGIIPHTSNTLITDVVYYGRLANANSIAGKFGDSEDMLIAARSRAYHTGPCLELVNMLYIEVYVRLWQFEQTPNPDLRNSLLMWGRIGLESLEQEAPDTKALWRRMFILRMVFSLLGLGNRANRIQGCQVDTACIKEAESLLADIDRHWTGIETRREMFYWVAKARLSEWQKKPTACLRFLKKAQRLALEGRFEEFSFISEYIDSLSTPPSLSSAALGVPSESVVRNCVTSEQHSVSLCTGTLYMRPECENYRNENTETEIFKRGVTECNADAGVIRTTFSYQLEANATNERGPSDINLVTECTMSSSADIMLPSNESSIPSERKQQKLHQLKVACKSLSYTDRKIPYDEENNSVFMNLASKDMMNKDETSLKQVNTENQNDNTTPKAILNKKSGECLHIDSECRVDHNNCKTLREPASFINILKNPFEDNDPFAQLESDALFEERGEPSGCSHENAPVVPGCPEAPKNMSLISSDADSMGEAGSINSLDLFGDGRSTT